MQDVLVMELWYIFLHNARVESKKGRNRNENIQPFFKSLRMLKSIKVVFNLCGK